MLAAIATGFPAGAAAEQASQPTSAAAGQLDVSGGTGIDESGHSCAVLDGGAVRCWGFGGDGRLGYCNEVDIGDDERPGSAGPVNLATSECPPQPPPPPPPVPPTPPVLPVSPGPCGTPGAAGYLFPAKMRVSRARVLREDRRLDVLAPITSRARGAEVEVTYQGDGRSDTFDAEVTQSGTELDHVRFLEPITRGQAELGTGIVNLNYLGDEDTRPEFVRLRAASQQDDGDWVLEDDQVPAQLAQCGGYLSIQFTGFFERRIRGEQLAYELNAGQTRRP